MDITHESMEGGGAMKDERDDLKLMSKSDLVKILRTSESTIDRKMREDPEFPAARRLGKNSLRWISVEVYAYIRALPMAADWGDCE